MKQYDERNYAPKSRKLEKNDLQLKDKQDEKRRQEESIKAPQGRQEGIQTTDKRRSETQESPNVVKEKEVENDARNGSDRSDEGGGDSDSQQEGMRKGLVVVQNVSGKSIKPKRKKRDSKNSNERSQKTKGHEKCH